MNNTTQNNIQLNKTDIQTIVKAQRDFFDSDTSKDLSFRREQLLKLKRMMSDNEQAIIDALHKDLRKHEFEAYATEIGFVLVEIDKTLAKLSKWAKPKKVKTPPFLYVATSSVQAEPYGNILIIAPWNYPVQLMIAPLIIKLDSF